MSHIGIYAYLYSSDMTGSETLYLLSYAIGTGFLAGFFISVLLHWINPD